LYTVTKLIETTV